jgi:hypothetical protein
MASALTSHDTGYGLAEAAILSHSLLTASTLPDVLARHAVVAATADQPAPLARRIVIKKRGWSGPAELSVSGFWPASFLKSAGAVVDLLNLPAGWNSYGAKPIAPQNAVQAIQLLAEFIAPGTPPPAVVPRVRGGIQIEWHAESVDVEVYIDSPGKVSFFVEQLDTGETFDGPLAGHEAVLKTWLQNISGK